MQVSFSIGDPIDHRWMTDDPTSTDDETERVAQLRAYGVLDTPNEPAFDRLVRQAARMFDAPIALISLVDEHRQWFKARIGLAAPELPRSISFCTHAIRGNGVMVVEDAAADDRFADNPLVTGAPNIRFYAGAPLRTPEGKRIGTICVIDTAARTAPAPADQEKLVALADRTVAAFARRQAR